MMIITMRMMMMIKMMMFHLTQNYYVCKMTA